MPAAEHRERYEPRGSRTDLGGRGGETPRRDSPYPGRYARPAAARYHPCGRHPGPRRRRAADEFATRPVSILAEALRRQRISGTKIPARTGTGLRTHQRRDFEALRCRQVCGVAEALDRRTDNWMAQPLPAPGQGLGMPEPKWPRVPTLGVCPADDAKALSGHDMIR